MVLSVEEQALVNAVRALPPQEAKRVLLWASQLADLAGGREVDWSDVWTEQDVIDATNASVRQLDEREPEES